MKFEPTEDQRRIRDDRPRVRGGGDRAGRRRARERRSGFRARSSPRLGEMGILGMMVPEEYGGSGSDALSYVLVIEELARVCASTAVIVSVNNSVVCYPIWKFGSEEQKKTMLTELASGRALGAYALSEQQSGSDAANQKTRAVRDGDSYVLDGSKVWITNAGEAQWYIVMAMTDPSAGTRGITAFLVSSEDPGLRIGAPEDKMGLRASKTAGALSRRACGSRPSRRLGEEGDGFRIAMTTLDHSRIGIAAQGIGIARAAYEASVEYAQTRETFGRKLAEHEIIAFQIADMKVQIEAAKLLTYRAALRSEPAGSPVLQGDLHGEGLRDRGRQRDRGAGGPDLRRLRILARVPGRALLPRRARDDDLRGNERDPENRHLEEPSRGADGRDERRASPGTRLPAPAEAVRRRGASPGLRSLAAGEKGRGRAGPAGPGRTSTRSGSRSTGRRGLPAVSRSRRTWHSCGSFPAQRGNRTRARGGVLRRARVALRGRSRRGPLAPAEIRVIVDPYSRQAFLAQREPDPHDPELLGAFRPFAGGLHAPR